MQLNLKLKHYYFNYSDLVFTFATEPTFWHWLTSPNVCFASEVTHQKMFVFWQTRKRWNWKILSAQYYKEGCRVNWDIVLFVIDSYELHTAVLICQGSATLIQKLFFSFLISNTDYTYFLRTYFCSYNTNDHFRDNFVSMPFQLEWVGLASQK